MFCSPWKAWYELSKIPVSVGRAPYLERGSLIPKVTSLKNWLPIGKEWGTGPSQAGGGAVWDYIYHCGFLQWSHLVPREVDAACPSACQKRGLLPKGQRGWSRGLGHRRQREGTRPWQLSLLHTLRREMKSERDYVVPPSTTLIPRIPEVPFLGGSA